MRKRFLALLLCLAIGVSFMPTVFFHSVQEAYAIEESVSVKATFFANGHGTFVGTSDYEVNKSSTQATARYYTEEGNIVIGEIPVGSGETGIAIKPDNGYVFKGWYADAACTEEFDFGTRYTAITDPPHEAVSSYDVKIYAKWAKKDSLHTWVQKDEPSNIIEILTGSDFLNFDPSNGPAVETPKNGLIKSLSILVSVLDSDDGIDDLDTAPLIDIISEEHLDKSKEAWDSYGLSDSEGVFKEVCIDDECKVEQKFSMKTPDVDYTGEEYDKVTVTPQKVQGLAEEDYYNDYTYVYVDIEELCEQTDMLIDYLKYALLSGGSFNDNQKSELKNYMYSCLADAISYNAPKESGRYLVLLEPGKNSGVKYTDPAVRPYLNENFGDWDGTTEFDDIFEELGFGLEYIAASTFRILPTDESCDHVWEYTGLSGMDGEELATFAEDMLTKLIVSISPTRGGSSFDIPTSLQEWRELVDHIDNTAIKSILTAVLDAYEEFWHNEDAAQKIENRLLFINAVLEAASKINDAEVDISYEKFETIANEFNDNMNRIYANCYNAGCYDKQWLTVNAPDSEYTGEAKPVVLDTKHWTEKNLPETTTYYLDVETALNAFLDMAKDIYGVFESAVSGTDQDKLVEGLVNLISGISVGEIDITEIINAFNLAGLSMDPIYDLMNASTTKAPKNPGKYIAYTTTLKDGKVTDLGDFVKDLVKRYSSSNNKIKSISKYKNAKELEKDIKDAFTWAVTMYTVRPETYDKAYVGNGASIEVKNLEDAAVTGIAPAILYLNAPDAEYDGTAYDEAYVTFNDKWEKDSKLTSRLKNIRIDYYKCINNDKTNLKAVNSVKEAGTYCAVVAIDRELGYQPADAIDASEFNGDFYVVAKKYFSITTKTEEGGSGSGTGTGGGNTGGGSGGGAGGNAGGSESGSTASNTTVSENLATAQKTAVADFEKYVEELVGTDMSAEMKALVYDLTEKISKQTTVDAVKSVLLNAQAEIKLQLEKESKTSVTLKKSGKNVKLTWKAVHNATSYKVYGAKAGSGKAFKKLATVDGTKYTVKKLAGKKLAQGVKYKFYVVAYDKDGTKLTKSKTKSIVTKK